MFDIRLSFEYQQYRCVISKFGVNTALILRYYASQHSSGMSGKTNEHLCPLVQKDFFFIENQSCCDILKYRRNMLIDRFHVETDIRAYVRGHCS